MCGGDLILAEGSSVAECEYCGTRQTVPNADNEKKMTLFSRANRLRLACEFDKAASVYESLVAEFPTEAEAYWGLVLCRYGIEYVDDPTSGKKIPTCHRSSFDNILEDNDFEQACENADAVARRLYRDEAKAIEDIRRGILEVSGKEDPYDIFICYKETDEQGQRTVDSVIAQDVYTALTEKGYRVFFSRITLEDKLGTDYEPYIFAALNSAKVMLVFGTDYEYFNAVWVKNEWSRFLSLIEAGQKKTLIPCYKGVDAYDMPKEFARLQAQDMGKVGALQDLLRGIDKLLQHNQTNSATQTILQQSGGPTVNSLLKRGQMFLEDCEWQQAGHYFDKVLDIEPENESAYAGKFCVDRHYSALEKLAEDIDDLEKVKTNHNYQKAVRFGSDAFRAKLDEYYQAAEEKKKEHIFQVLCKRMESASAEECYSLAKRFENFNGYKNADACIQNCLQKVDELFCDLCAKMEGANTQSQFGDLAEKFKELSGYKDADQRRIECQNKMEECLQYLCKKRKSIAPLQDYLITSGSSIFGIQADNTVVALGNNDEGQCNVSNWADIVTISVDYGLTVGLKANGKVVAVGRNDYGQCNVSKWRNIIAIAAGSFHTAGLKSDGTVVITERKSEYSYDNDMPNWHDITAIASGSGDVVGLKSDGTVVEFLTTTTGRWESNLTSWKNIVAIFVEGNLTVGLHANGTVVATTCGSNKHDLNLSGWRNIVDISIGCGYIVGLTHDGKVVATGDNLHGECNVSDWKDIVAISTGGGYTVGLKVDGTVVATGANKYHECDVSNWKDIVAIKAGGSYTIGLCVDGTVVFTGSDYGGHQRVTEWKLFDNYETVYQERQDMFHETEAKRIALKKELKCLRDEYAKFNILFKGKRRREIEDRLDVIYAELRRLD